MIPLCLKIAVLPQLNDAIVSKNKCLSMIEWCPEHLKISVAKIKWCQLCLKIGIVEFNYVCVINYEIITEESNVKKLKFFKWMKANYFLKINVAKTPIILQIPYPFRIYI